MTTTVATEGWFQKDFDALKAWGVAEWNKVKSEVDPAIKALEKEIGTDLSTALETFGQELIADVVGMLKNGWPAHLTVSQAAINLYQTAVGQGKTLAFSTAQLAASQATVAATSALTAVAAGN